jgi:hypothetical protein
MDYSGGVWYIQYLQIELSAEVAIVLIKYIIKDHIFIIFHQLGSITM